MKKITRDKIGYFAIGVIVGAIIYTLLLGLNGDEYRLYTAYFEVLEENTEKPVNVGISLHPIEFDMMATGALPYYIELKENGPYRVTYIDHYLTDCKINISADGYEDKTIPIDMINEIRGKTSTSVSDFTPTPIYLKKIDQVRIAQ
tara:strand:+ start:1266 stop:1703 length:438 start_codon:yes stop_codon:yes gene_type:complete